MDTQECKTLSAMMESLDLKLARLQIYSHALEFAILYHCSGKTVPEDIAEIVPQYARYLNKSGCCKRPAADDELLNILSQDVAGREN